MRKTTNFGLTVVIALVASVSVFACEPPAPGQTSTPPCAVESALDQTVPNTDTTWERVDAIDVIITEAAIGLLQSALLIF